MEGDPTPISTSSGFKNNLCAGEYILEITDALGCVKEIKFTIESCDEITLKQPLSAYVTNSTNCNEPNGSIKFFPNEFKGGVYPLSFEWPGGSTTLNQYDLSAGAYSLTVTDNVGCKKVFTFHVKGDEVTILANVEPSCSGGNEGEISYALVEELVQTYNVTWNGGSNPNSPNSGTITGLAAGNYCFTVTGNTSNCTSVECFEVDAVANNGALTFSGVTTPSCPNNGTGKILTQVMGGTPPYDYQWSGYGINGPGGSYLASGNYAVTVTDYCGNEAEGVFEVGVEEFESALTLVDIPKICKPLSFTKVQVVPAGPVLENYNWYVDGELISEMASDLEINLTAGNHIIEAVASNYTKCTEIFEFTIEESDSQIELIEIISNSATISCTPQYIIPLFLGGNPPMTYVWRDENNHIISTEYLLTDVPYGDYNFEVTDNCGISEDFEYDLSCNCEPEFALDMVSLTPCVPPVQLFIRFDPDDLLLIGRYNFTWYNHKGEAVKHGFVDTQKNDSNNLTRHYTKSQIAKVLVDAPNGCSYLLTRELNFQKEFKCIIEMQEDGPFSDLVLMDLKEERPELFTESSIGSYTVQGFCAQLKKCNDKVLGIKKLETMKFLTTDPDSGNPCKSGGLITCNISNEEDDCSTFIDVPTNYLAEHFPNVTNATSGVITCGCLFPAEIFSNPDINHPIYVEYICDEIEAVDPDIEVEIVDIYNSDLCPENCGWCDYPNLEGDNCGYNVVCASTGEIIEPVYFNYIDWIDCRVKTSETETTTTFTHFAYCPSDPCTRVIQNVYIKTFVGNGGISWTDQNGEMEADAINYALGLPHCNCPGDPQPSEVDMVYSVPEITIYTHVNDSPNQMQPAKDTVLVNEILTGFKNQPQISNKKKPFALKVIPIPFNSRFRLEIEGLKNIGFGNLRMYDVMGQGIYSSTLDFGSIGEFIINFEDMGHLAPGIYFINLTLDDGQSITKKIMKY